MFFIKSALVIGLPPAVSSLLILLVASLASKRGQLWLSRLLTGLAVAVGYSIGHRIATGTLTLVPHSSEQWLPLLGLAVGVLSAIENFPKLPKWLGLIWKYLLGFAGISALLLPSTVLTTTAKVAWIFALSIAATLVWSGLDAFAEREASPLLPFSWSLVAAMGSAALFIAHSAVLSQLSGVLAATLGGTFVFVALQRKWSLAKGAAGVFAILLFGIGVNGIFYADLPLFSAILIWLSPLASWVRTLIETKGLPAWAQVISQLSTTFILAACGVGFAVYKLGLPQGGY